MRRGNVKNMGDIKDITSNVKKVLPLISVTAIVMIVAAIAPALLIIS